MSEHFRYCLLCALCLFVSSPLSSAQKDSAYIARFFEQEISAKWSPGVQDSIEAFEKKATNPRKREFYHFFAARYLMQNGKFQESLIQAKKGTKLLQADTSDFGLVKFYNLIASNASYTKDYVTAVQYFNRSIAISEAHGNKQQTAYLNNNIANIFFSIQDYPASYTYASRAYELIKAFPNDKYHALICAILSVAEAKTGRTAEAEKHAGEALSSAQKSNDAVSIIVANYAFGDIALSKNAYEQARVKFTESLELSDQIQHLHLSMLNNIGLTNVCLGLNEYEAAARHGEKSLELARLLNNSNTLYSIHRRLATAYHALKQDDKAYQNLLTAFELYRETTNTEKQEIINDILIKYDTEKKENEIARQKVLLLEKDVQTANFRQIIIILSVVLSILVMLFLFVRYRNKQRALQTASENERKLLDALIRGEEVERTRLSHELHDGLASALTAIRFQLQNSGMPHEQEKESLLEMLQRAHEDTRRISHNLSPLLLEQVGLEASLKQFALENTTQECSVSCSITGTLKLSPNAALITYRTIQELVQNALKHSGASQITVHLFGMPNRVRIMTEDNGCGFDPALISPSGGLMHLKKRLSNLEGEMEIDSSEKTGTVIHIELPI